MSEEYAAPDQVLTWDDWQDAYNVQSACNLSGVVRSYAKTMSKIWAEANAQGRGTDWVNHHPIAVLFADKVAHLAGAKNDHDLIWEAYSAYYRRRKAFAVQQAEEDKNHETDHRD